MSYVNRTGNDVIPTESVIAGRVGEYHDRVRWGLIIAGLLVSLATQYKSTFFQSAFCLNS